MEQELALKIIGGVIVVGGAFIALLIKICGKKKELKMQREYENEQKKEKFNSDVVKAYDLINDDADNQQIVCHDVTKDYPRDEGDRYKKKIESLERLVKYADKCIDTSLKGVLDEIVNDMMAFHERLCKINVWECQNQGYQNMNAPYGTRAFDVAAQQSAMNNECVAKAMTDCERIKSHWRFLYKSIGSKIIKQ